MPRSADRRHAVSPGHRERRGLAPNGGSHLAEARILETPGGRQSAGTSSAYGAGWRRRSLKPTELSLPHSFWLISILDKKGRHVNIFLEINFGDMPSINNQRADV
jgi:hypothetical protein